MEQQAKLKSFDHFIHWVFYGVVSIGGYMAIDIIKDVNESIEKLNTNVAIVIERTTGNKEDLQRHEKRLDRLESRRN
tara:strand:+ start:1142 stop:1372 length:231 start_codon:yes stop_codon:yes gene_type:complete